MHYALMTNKAEDVAALDALAAKNGVDIDKAHAFMKSDAARDHINKVMTLGADLNVSGTPTFVIGDQAINGARMDDLKAAVDAQRKALNKG
jgi:protein-disulfide isomerase